MSALTAFSRRFSPEYSNEQSNLDSQGNPIRCVQIPMEGLEAFINRVGPSYKIYDYTRAIIQDLTDGYLGLIDELCLNIPPRMGKTSLLEYFCAWAMLNDSRIHIGYCGFNKEIAQDPCKNAREHYISGGGELNPAQSAKINWETKNRGKMWAAGFGGTVRGRGYHIGIVDDAHKDSSELFSDAKLRKWQGFVDKLWPNRAMVHTHRPIFRIWVGQRLGDNDVFGYLAAKPDASKYTFRIFDLIRDTETPFPLPNHITIRNDRRKNGEFLCPERCTPSFMADAHADEDEFDSQYQQRPRPVSGTIFSVDKIHIVDRSQVPLLRLITAGIDLAISTKASADWTVVYVVGYGVDGRWYFLGQYRERKESPQLRTEIPLFLRRFGVALVGVDATAYQTSFVQELRADPFMAGITVIECNKGLDRSDKVVFARSWNHLMDQELVCFVENPEVPWADPAKKEFRDFPRGKHDDRVDAAGYAIKIAQRCLVGAETPGAQAA